MAKKEEEVPTLVVVSRLKDFIKEQEMRSGEEFVTAINDAVVRIVKDAAARAKANGRATLKAEDI